MHHTTTNNALGSIAMADTGGSNLVIPPVKIWNTRKFSSVRSTAYQ